MIVVLLTASHPPVHEPLQTEQAVTNQLRKSLFEGALSSESEDTAGLRGVFSDLRGAQEPLQTEQAVTNQLRIEVENLQEKVRDLEALQIRSMSDRVTIHKLEKKLDDAKTVINVLSDEVDRLRNEEFVTPD
ncbi:hypothetical protein Efla_004404 [Eimeria flavescens]